MEKRTFIAIILCVLVIALYPYFMAKFYPPREMQKTPAPIAAVEKATAEVPRIEKPILQELPETEIAFQADKYRVLLSNRGGMIKSLEILDYKDQLGRPYRLLHALDAGVGPLSVLSPDKVSESACGIYEFKRKDSGIIFTKRLQDGILISKEYNFPKGKHSIELQIKIVNEKESPTAFGYKLIGGAGIDTDKAVDGRFLEIDSLVGGKLQRESGARMKKDGLRRAGEISWCALKNKYFCAILRPELPANASFANLLDDKGLVTGIEIMPIIIKGNSSITHNYLFYAGPSEYGELKSYHFKFEETLYGGIFSGISRLLMSLLNLFNKVVHNWGISIILLTIAVSICLYPLTLRSLRSMKEMQAVAPQVEELKKQLKGNPQKLNKEIMELYKKHKVNPFGGCLPMVLQMPVYIALYQGLIRAIELRGAKFLWIKDLSGEDALFRINNFNLNLLPILTAVVMYAQQRLSMPGRTMDEQQKMMSYIFPVMFGFIFYKFPSGFVLYFLTSTFLTALYQYRVTHHHK